VAAANGRAHQADGNGRPVESPRACGHPMLTVGDSSTLRPCAQLPPADPFAVRLQVPRRPRRRRPIEHLAVASHGPRLLRRCTLPLTERRGVCKHCIRVMHAVMQSPVRLRWR
jgi:hypothetical protein